jgi:hypothetical protein
MGRRSGVSSIADSHERLSRLAAGKLLEIVAHDASGQ